MTSGDPRPTSSRRQPTGQADSAGVPWSGRTLGPQPFAGDPGDPDPVLADALTRFAAGSAQPADVVAALAPARLMVAVVATESQTGIDQVTGLPADSRADMALVTLTGQDGRRALPAFTGLGPLAAWDPQARPVPVEAARAAQACVAEGCDLILLDPAGPVTFPVGRPAVWALGRGRAWLPSPADPEVIEAVTRAVRADRSPDSATSLVRAVGCEPGRRAELRVRVVLSPGLDRDRLDAVLAEVAERLAADPVLAERVESLELAPEVET